MATPYEIALDALQKMQADIGADSKFSADQIWAYASEEVPSRRRPGAITKLRRNELILPTGTIRNAASPQRAGSKVPEYRFAVSGQQAVANANTSLAQLLPDFIELANHIDVGLRVSSPLFLRFAAALGSKRFLILSGLAGSGKTKLAQAFARWLTPEDEEFDSHVVIPVGADWTGSDAILGYPDGIYHDRYVTRPALELIQRAMLHEEYGLPHFLILDEMNLSHVERYFADLLSLIESGDSTDLYKPEHDNEGNAILRSKIDPALRLPSNLFIIGTVNVDETTYMFSPKVLDRANVIEFRV